jgi:cytochrome d ubiquinol oxidase subunit I
MGFSLGFHIVFAALGVGLPVLMLVAEGMALRTGDPTWMALARRWSKAFAVLFAVGAVSGTVLSFELGLLWPTFMGRFGASIGLAFTLEGFAFFLEAIFLGIYLYGWQRLSPRAHFWCGVPVAASGAASAIFVVGVNAWMNQPVDAGPLAFFRTPAAGPQIVHMVIAAYAATGLGVASVYAAGMLRGRRDPIHRRGMATGLALGLAMSLLQPLSGDWAAKTVARTQPVKLAAMEGQWTTEARAPLRLGGIPDEKNQRTRFAIEIPGGLSWMAYGDSSATVRGLASFPERDRPPAAIVHVAFQIMVAIGSALILLALVVGLLALRKRLPEGKLLLSAIVLAGPASFLAIEAGWTVTEVGRQPWIVQGLFRTADAVTPAPGLLGSLLLSLAIYFVLAGGALLVLLHLARRARSDEKQHA